MALTQVDPGLLNSNSQYTMYKNRLINGSFQVWQRGTTFNNAQSYTADRWKCAYNDDGANMTQVASGLSGFTYALQMIKGANQYGGSMVQQGIESANTVDMVGQQVTLSVWAKFANSVSPGNQDLSLGIGFFSATDASNVWLNSADICSYYAQWKNTGPLGVVFQAGTQSSGGTYYQAASGNGQMSTSWQRFSVTVTVPANCGTIYVGMYSESTPYTGGMVFTGAQLEKGSVMTSFDSRPNEVELAMCQRYYEQTAGMAGFFSANSAHLRGTMKVSKRTQSPTIGYSNSPMTVLAANSGDAAGTNTGSGGTDQRLIAFNNDSAHVRLLNMTGTGVTNGFGCILTDAQYFTFDAEM
jgi:hypothetical protein